MSELSRKSEEILRPLKVLVCEDSKTDREVLLRLLLRSPRIDVVAVAERGEDVLPYVERFHPDLLTIDLNLPGRSGIEVIEEVMSASPLPILVISGQAEDARVAMEALAAGAVEVIAKPEIKREDDFDSQGKRLADLVGVLSRVKVIRHPRARVKLPGSEPGAGAGAYHSRPRPGRGDETGGAIGIREPLPKKIVGLAASTGGPQALKVVLTEIGPALPAPLLVVQHIAAGFTESFAEWLAASTGLEVKLAEDGEALENGMVYVGPEENHMLVRGGKIVLEPPERRDRHCPSADRLFESMAAEVGSGAVCVVLTGMGNDGAAGAREARAKGAAVIVQDEATSAVFGMPNAALEAGAASKVVPLEEIGAAVLEAVVGQGLGSTRPGRLETGV